MSKNTWKELTGYYGCTHPCDGYPILKTEPGPVWLAAHELPVFLQCSECGHAPGPDVQPALIRRYVEKLLYNDYRTRQQIDGLKHEAKVLDGALGVGADVHAGWMSGLRNVSGAKVRREWIELARKKLEGSDGE